MDGRLGSEWKSFLVSPRWQPHSKATVAAPAVAGHRSNLKSSAFRRSAVRRVNIRGAYRKGKKGVGIRCRAQMSNHRGFGTPPTTLPWCTSWVQVAQRAVPNWRKFSSAAAKVYWGSIEQISTVWRELLFSEEFWFIMAVCWLIRQNKTS